MLEVHTAPRCRCPAGHWHEYSTACRVPAWGTHRPAKWFTGPKPAPGGTDRAGACSTLASDMLWRTHANDQPGTGISARYGPRASRRSRFSSRTVPRTSVMLAVGDQLGSTHVDVVARAAT